MGANMNSSNANFHHMKPVSSRNAHLIGDTDSEVAFRPGPESPKWKRREKVLLACFIIILALAVALIIVVIIQNNPSALKSEPPVCYTEECIKTASRMLGAMDKEVDPCDDFFEYACGTWNKRNIIPDDRSNYNTFGMLRDELQVILKGLLEVPVSETDNMAITYAKNLYISCMNETLIEKRGEEPLRLLLSELGGWPVLDPNWSEGDFDLTDLLAKLRLYNNRILINQWVSSDDKDSSVNVIQVDQASLGMPSREYYLKGRDDKQLMAYETLAREVAMKLGAQENTTKKEMKDMVDFEVELANITVADADRRDTEALYNKMTMADLVTNVTDYFEWQRYMTLIFANVSMSVNSSETMVIYAPEHLKQLANLLRRTPSRTVANYLIWRIVINRLASMPQAYLDLRRSYNKALYGTNSDRARWRTCVNYVNSNFGMAVGRMFVQEHFNEKAKGTALEMIENIRVSFNELLNDVDWMDADTRKMAKLKAEAIQEKIGYPDYILNDTALSIDYEGVNIDPDRYFENVLNNLNTVSRDNLKNLRKPVDKSKWSTTPAVVNAFYSATKNQIMFPAGIFQPPFYKETYPKSLNFGGIAVIIGHEITHGFDDKGRQFDKDGNLRQWWSEQVIDRFKEKAQCIIDQYGNYTVPGININLNGKNTQGENIADNGGLKQAFTAYRSWVKKRGKEEDLLPGLKLSNNQLFFLNFAQIWCGTARPESYIQAISSGRHSPGRFRVIGPLSNSQDFAEAYQCSAGSKMNPRKKCAVW